MSPSEYFRVLQTTMSSSFSTSSSSRPAANVAVGIGIGIAVGLIVPKIVASWQVKASSSKDDPNVHAARSGLASGIRMSRDKLDDFVSQILVGAGCTPEGAKLVANVLTYADSRGIPSHGVNRADAYVNEIRAGLVDPTAVPVIEKCSGSTAVINGNNGLGAVTSELAMETALDLAKQHGVALVTCRASNHYGAAGYWAKMALDRRCIGMSFTNTSPVAVPTRSRERGLGTNPFCFFAPASANDSFQLDMATTTVPIGKVEVLNRLGKPCPRGWGVDRHGNDCSDSAEICKFGGLYPLGGAEETAGYKGYGLGMFVEIMCSVLSNAGVVGPDVSPWTVARGRPLDYGHCFLVIDPERLAPDFDSRLRGYLDRMRNLPGDNVQVAGDPEKEFERDAAENGILLHGPVATTLKALAKRYNVTVPRELENLDETKSKASLYE